jgi:hypothetical protein
MTPTQTPTNTRTPTPTPSVTPTRGQDILLMADPADLVVQIASETDKVIQQG